MGRTKSLPPRGRESASPAKRPETAAKPTATSQAPQPQPHTTPTRAASRPKQRRKASPAKQRANGDRGAPGASSKASSARRGKLREPSSDAAPIALLLLLYTLQGIPMGLSGSMPFLIQAAGASLADQARFSTVSLPFSFKLLWAPLVDALYWARFGRRKTWIVPAQLAIGATLIAAAPRLEAMLGVGGGTLDVSALTWIFRVLYLLAATQDIAVDGLALTVLSEKNRELGATCHAVGQSVGYFLAYTVFLAFNNADFCNTYLRAAPQPTGMVTLPGFVAFWGWAFLFSTACVLFVRRDEHHTSALSPARALANAYREMVTMLRLPAVQSFVGIMLTCKIGFAVFDAVVPLRLVEAGLPKEHLALLASVVMPVGMASQAYVSYRYFSGGTTRPLSVWLAAFPVRLACAGLSFFLVQLVAAVAADSDGASLPAWLYALLLITTIVATVAQSVMFVGQMAFYNKVADPAIGGTYMTMLNTLSNLGSLWPVTAALYAVDMATAKSCDCTKSRPWHEQLLAVLPQSPSAPAQCPCVVEVDGFSVVAAASAAAGLLWFVAMRHRVQRLEMLPLSEWQVSSE